MPLNIKEEAYFTPIPEIVTTISVKNESSIKYVIGCYLPCGLKLYDDEWNLLNDPIVWNSTCEKNCVSDTEDWSKPYEIPNGKSIIGLQECISVYDGIYLSTFAFVLWNTPAYN